MQTIAIISQKGGAGKSTLAVHLGVEAAKEGKNVAIIDLDPQASSASWGDRRADELPVVISAHASRLPQQMKLVEENGGEFLVIDTAPHADSAALDAARASDLVLVPCAPNIFDIEAALRTCDLLKAAGRPFFVVLNEVAPVGRSEADEAEAVFKERALPVCPARVAKRVAFSRCLSEGQVASEFDPADKGGAEIARLHHFVCAQLQVCTGAPVQPSSKEEDHVQQA